MPLEWTKTPPTVPGWYWVEVTTGEFRHTYPGELHPAWPGEFSVGDCTHPFSAFSRWAGPIPEPREGGDA